MGEKMRILIITPYAEPEKGACVVRVNGFAEHFKAAGHEVSVFAPKRENVREAKGVNRYNDIPGFMASVLKGRFDAIIGTSPPLTHNFFALLAAKISGAKFFLDAKDPFTDVMRKMEPEKASSIKFMLFEIMESFTHKFSDRIIFLNRPYLENALKKFNLPREKAFLAPNGSDTEKVFFDAKAMENTRKELGLGKDFTLIYVGGIGDKDLTGFVNESFPVLAQKHGAQVVFILSYEGTPVQEKIVGEIKDALKKNGLENRAKLVFNIEFSQLYKYLSACDAGLVAYPDFEMQVLGAKVFDYIAAGLPIAAKASRGNTELRNFIEANKIGFMATKWGDFNENFRKFFTGKKKFSQSEIIKVAQNNSRQKSCEKVLSEMEKSVGKK